VEGRIDFTRLDVRTRVIGGASLLLFLALEMPWYTTAPRPGVGGLTGSSNAMVAGGWRWLLWAGCLSVVGYVFLESVTSFERPTWLRREETLTAITGLNLLLVLIGALVDSPLPRLGGTRLATLQSAGTSWGAWIALAAATAAAGASLLALRDRRLDATDRLAGEAIAYERPFAERPSYVRAVEPDPFIERPRHARPLEPEPFVERWRSARTSEPKPSTQRPLHARPIEPELAELREDPVAEPGTPVGGHAARAQSTAAAPVWVPRPDNRESVEVPEPGSDPPADWMPPQPPPPPPL
jgi:hypothetical protein